jgi:hypothetical protein
MLAENLLLRLAFASEIAQGFNLGSHKVANKTGFSPLGMPSPRTNTLSRIRLTYFLAISSTLSVLAKRMPLASRAEMHNIV